MLLYLSSQKFGNDVTVLKEWIKEHNNKILLIFNAMDAKNQEKINNNIEEDIMLLETIGFEVKVVDLKDYFGKKERLKQDFKEYNAYCIMGGNVFVLRQAMYYSGLDDYLKEISLDNDCLYIGYSAGSCVMSNNLKILDIVDEPISFYNNNEIIYTGIGLIDYVIVTHYKSAYHKVNLIDDVVEKCKKESITYKVIKDGEVIIENLKNQS